MGNFIGNERAVAAVQRALASGSPPHAWLFAGPERLGKATLARMLAQTLNCTANDPTATSVGAQHTSVTHRYPEPGRAAPGDGWGAPCGECAQCRRIAAGIHSDVQTVAIELDDDGRRRKGIGVDQLREVERSVALKPYEGRTRVVIVDPADDMTTEAQNAFLKTLEEPPPSVVFVLIATREERLLPTVRSRCRRVEFRLVPAAAIEAALLSGSEDPGLRSGGTEAEQARLLSRLAIGRAGWALEMAAKPSLLEKRRETLDQARALSVMPLADRFDLAERLSGQFKNDRESVDDRLEEWLGWQRDVLLVQSGAEEGAANADMLDELREDARRCDRREVLAFVQALIACREHLASNVQSRIALDALMVQAPRKAITHQVQ
jgi:DNA polymerase-3 subunit delta'